MFLHVKCVPSSEQDSTSSSQRAAQPSRTGHNGKATPHSYVRAVVANVPATSPAQHHAQRVTANHKHTRRARRTEDGGRRRKVRHAPFAVRVNVALICVRLAKAITAHTHPRAAILCKRKNNRCAVQIGKAGRLCSYPHWAIVTRVTDHCTTHTSKTAPMRRNQHNGA